MTYINKLVDIIIAAALLLAIYTFMFVNEDGNEIEAELSPIDAKVQQYCNMVENSDNVPLHVKQACEARKSQDTEESDKPDITKSKLSV